MQQPELTESQYGALYGSVVKQAKKAGRVMEALTVGFLLFAFGAFAGWWVRDNQAQTNRMAMRADHLAEIKRLNDSYSLALDYMSGKVASAAVAASTASDKAEATVIAADKAVDKATVAADKATTAANKAATVARKVESDPVPSREAVNRAVEKANQSIKK